MSILPLLKILNIVDWPFHVEGSEVWMGEVIDNLDDLKLGDEVVFSNDTLFLKLKVVEINKSESSIKVTDNFGIRAKYKRVNNIWTGIGVFGESDTILIKITKC